MLPLDLPALLQWQSSSTTHVFQRVTHSRVCRAEEQEVAVVLPLNLPALLQ
jgi:hypothetical protein